METSLAKKRSQQLQCGPLPSAQTSKRVRNLSKARGKVLELLSNGPCTVSSLAMLTGQHENTIREHLDALVYEDLAIRYRGDEHMRGRPAWSYRIPDESQPSQFNEYAGLASALADTIARHSNHPRKDAIEAGKAWAPDLVRSSKLKPRSDVAVSVKKNSTAARRNTVTLLDHLGFAPIHNVSLTKIQLTRCPLLNAARQHPEIICEVHLGIIRGALEEFGADAAQIEKTSLAPFSYPGACILKM